MDRGAWRATVHGAAKNWTQLKQISTHTHTEAGANTDIPALNSILFMPSVTSPIYLGAAVVTSIQLGLEGPVHCVLQLPSGCITPARETAGAQSLSLPDS